MHNSLATWLISSVLIVSCQMKVEPPERLPPIPETATWKGGVDGGAWIECSLDEEKRANWCTVWSDQTGAVWARTYFVQRQNGEPVPESELNFRGFSGTYIDLIDGRMLEPLKFHGDDEHDLWEPTPIDPPRDELP